MSKKTLTLSIIIPVYNEENYIAKCLDSIAAQTLRPDEVIVVNNNSRDKTAKIVRKYGFVKLINEPRQSVYYATNRGFETASAEIIGRIDADTILPTNWTAQVMKDFRSETIAATNGPVSYYDMPWPNGNYRLDHMMRQLTYKWSPQSPFLYGSNMAVRRSAWEKIRAETCADERVHEDIDIAIHLYKNRQKILYNKKLLAQASGRRYNDSFRSFYKYLRMFSYTYHKHQLYPKAIYPAMFMWGLGYLLMHPWRNIWYFVYGKFNKKYPISSQVRKNPMSFY